MDVGGTRGARVRGSLLLWLLFFLIAAGLGYPTLRYYDPRTRGPMDSAILYHDLVTGETSANSLMQGESWWFEHRVLVPLIARPFYLAARGRIGSWDPVFFGLLIANALLMATAATLLLRTVAGLGLGSATALISSLLLYVNFATPAFYMAALVDSVELVAVVITIAALLKRQWLWLPAIAAVAVTGKESFLPLGAAFAGGWLLASWRHEPRRSLAGMSIAFMVLSGAVALTLLAATRGHPMLWMSTPALASMTLADYGTTITWLVTDRGLLYVFGWLLPLAVPSLRLLPAPWRAGTLAAAAMAFALGVVGGEQSVNRALMNVAGPLLCAAAALTVLRVARAAHPEAPPYASNTVSTESQTNAARRG